MLYNVYVIQSKSSGKIYIGQTSNLKKRLDKHNKLLKIKRTSFTYRNKGPWKVVFQEGYETREEAVKREIYLKSHTGRDWLRKVMGR
jgi:putative endonuclease